MQGREVESMEDYFVFLSNLSNIERIYFVYATIVSGGYISHNVDDEKCKSQREVAFDVGDKFGPEGEIIHTRTISSCGDQLDRLGGQSTTKH